AAGHHRRQAASAGRAVHGGGHPEPAGAAGHLSAARGPARPVPVQAGAGLSEPGGGAPHRRRPRHALGPGRSNRDGRRSRRGRRGPVGRGRGGGGHPAGRRDRRLRAEAGARHPRDGRTAERRQPAQRRHAGARRPRPRGPRRPRLRHPGRRQASGPAGSAPPRYPLPRRRDRRPPRRRRHRRPDRTGRGAAVDGSCSSLRPVAARGRQERTPMIYPTPRAILLVAAGAAPALGLALAAPGFWVASLAWLLAASGLILADVLLAPPAGSVELELKAPGSLGVGRSVEARLAAVFPKAAPRAVELALSAGERLALEPARPVAAVAGRRAAAAGPLRRGEGRFEAAWARWRGPLGLAFIQREAKLDEVAVITPDVQSVTEEALRLFSHDAPFGAKVQRDVGEGAEFHALKEYQQGMD